MSRKGDCWDNAVAESFLAIIIAELIGHAVYATHDAGSRRLRTTSSASTTRSVAFRSSRS